MNHIISKPIKRIGIIHDLVGFGRAGMMNIIPILSELGIESCPIPTSIFSTHTAYNSPAVRYLNGFVSEALEHYKKLNVHFDAIIIGYIGNAGVIDEIESNILYFKEDGSKIIFDPIFADNDKIYSNLDKEYIENLKKLIPYSDIILPNITEARFLTREENTLDICKTLLNMGARNIIITGADTKSKKELSIATYIDGAYNLNVYKRHKNSFVGTGDIFTGMLGGLYTLNVDIQTAIDRTHHFIYDCINYSSNFNYDKKEGIIIEGNLNLIGGCNGEKCI